MLISYRLPQLDEQFQQLLVTEAAWPAPLPSAKGLYTRFFDEINQLIHNIVCASCGCINHRPDSYELVPITYEPLHLLAVPVGVNIPFDFSCGINLLDERRILLDKNGITSDRQNVILCNSCYSDLQHKRRPVQSLSNFRWMGPVPNELQNLTWLEEQLIARSHLVGKIVRLSARNASSYFAIKGHTILLPQDTTRLLDILPLPPASLPDILRVVWTGKSTPEKSRLDVHFTVRRQKVYDALHWLCNNHDDYRHVTIDEERWASSESTIVATELLDSMGRVADITAEDASRSGFATEDLDTAEYEGDLPTTTSALLDVNNVSVPPQVSTLNTLASLKSEVTVNVVMGNKIINDHEDETFFTSAFPTLFPYGVGKHIDSRRNVQLSLGEWAQLMLKHSSRYITCVSFRANVAGGFRHTLLLSHCVSTSLECVTTAQRRIYRPIGVPGQQHNGF
jgi:Domain of unknown function (DUF6570)